MHFLYGLKDGAPARLVATFDSQQQLLAYVRWATLQDAPGGRKRFEQGSALVGYNNEQEHRDRLQRVTEADRTALDLARVQYRAGLADFLTVLDAERTLSENEDQLAQSQTTVVTGLVSLHKALGGGWPAAASVK